MRQPVDARTPSPSPSPSPPAPSPLLPGSDGGLGAVRAAFSGDYAEARRTFLAAAEAAGLSVDSRPNPRRGPHGELLATDVAWAGPRAARRVLVLVSGTHGVEGFCGSGIQCDWLLSGGPARLPDNCAVLLVHAANPWGFAWLRRVTEEGVDLNRNFIDFTAPLPPDEGYAAIAEAVVPRGLDGPAWEQAGEVLADHAATHGRRAFEMALSSGQYTHPDGLFHGGRAPTWARRTLEAVAYDYELAERCALAVIDLHTGLGPFGYGELICDHPPGSPGVEHARAWFGRSVTEPLLGEGASVPKRGLVDFFWHGLTGRNGCMLTLEFGTSPLAEIIDALRADHWLHAQGGIDWNAPHAQAIKRRLRHAFYPDTVDWEEMVLFRGRQVIRQALAGLSSLQPRD